jgi:hypothetical protein
VQFDSPAGQHGEHERTTGLPSGAAYSLEIASDAARQRSEPDSGKVTNINAKFQGRRAGEDVRGIRGRARFEAAQSAATDLSQQSGAQRLAARMYLPLREIKAVHAAVQVRQEALKMYELLGAMLPPIAWKQPSCSGRIGSGASP